ncbi:MAG: hypothetical protein KJ077_08355 [Anaerolineae bacterium]|nr:hypothetical protein [Anaerolineae bacterium]
MVRISTGISLPEPIMRLIDRTKESWFCDRSAAITRIVQEWEQLRANQLPLTALMPAEPESEAEQVRRLKVQELPGFIPNELFPVRPSRSPQERHLGTGPGDDVDEEGADGDL